MGSHRGQEPGWHGQLGSLEALGSLGPFRAEKEPPLLPWAGQLLGSPPSIFSDLREAPWKEDLPQGMIHVGSRHRWVRTVEPEGRPLAPAQAPGGPPGPEGLPAQRPRGPEAAPTRMRVLLTQEVTLPQPPCSRPGSSPKGLGLACGGRGAAVAGSPGSQACPEAEGGRCPEEPAVNGLLIPFDFTSSKPSFSLPVIELLLSASDLNSKVY